MKACAKRASSSLLRDAAGCGDCLLALFLACAAVAFFLFLVTFDALVSGFLLPSATVSKFCSEALRSLAAALNTP